MSDEVAALAKINLNTLKEWELRIAACVQAANEMLAVQPILTDHHHRLHLGICASELVRFNPHFSLFAVPVSSPEQMRGTGVPVVPAATLPAPASVPVSGDIEARLARMEIRLGSLLSFAPELDGLATSFAEHFHPFPFSWGTVADTINKPGLAIFTPGSAWSMTNVPNLTPPAIDPQAELPRLGTPLTQLTTEARTARVGSVIADLEPLYARVSAVTRAFATHVHPVAGASLTVATLTQSHIQSSYVLGKTANDGDIDFMSAAGRRR